MSLLVRRKPSAERECIMGFTTRSFEVSRLLADSKSVKDIAGLTRLAIRLGIITP